MVTVGLACPFAHHPVPGLNQGGVPGAVASKVANLPPTGALFAAFLGYNPMKTILPAAVLNSLPSASQTLLLSKEFFPNLIASPFDAGLRLAFSISVALVVIAALASLLRGKRVIYGQENHPNPARMQENEGTLSQEAAAAPSATD